MPYECTHIDIQVTNIISQFVTQCSTFEYKLLYQVTVDTTGSYKSKVPRKKVNRNLWFNTSLAGN